MNLSAFRAPGAWLPLAMSAAALAVVVIHIAEAGVAREADEGAAAHIWQLLVLGQAPIIGWFLLRSLRSGARPVALILAAQIAGLVLAAAPVAILGL